MSRTYSPLFAFGIFLALLEPPPARSQPLPSGWCTHDGAQLLSADVDGDGRVDAVCHDRSTGAKWVALGTDSGFVERWADLSSGWCSHAGAELFIGDVTADRRADLVCKDPGRVWFDYGTARFFEGTDGVIDSNWCTHTGSTFSIRDVDADGRSDMVCTGDDSTLHVDFAIAPGFTGTTDFFGTCTTRSRASFVPSEPTDGSSATVDGDLRVNSTSVAAESKTSQASVTVEGFSETDLTALTASVASPTVVSGGFEFAGAPAGSWLQAGAALRLSVLDSDNRELCADEQFLGGAEHAGLSGDGPLNHFTRPMSCTTRHVGAFKARMTLRGWTTAVLFGSAHVDGHVRVPPMAIDACTAR